MNSNRRWIIEARKADGSLDLSGPQPESVFGIRAIHGITETTMAAVIFRRLPDAIMHGTNIAQWPALIDPRWIAREKTW